MRTSKLHRFILLIALMLGVSSTAFAEETATDFVRAKSDEIIRIVNTSKDKTTRLEKLNVAVKSVLDYDLLAQRTLAMHWETLNDTQRNEFTVALKELLETSYVKNLGDKTVDPGSYAVQFTDERERRGRYTVSGIVKVEDTTRYIDLRLQKSDVGWRVYDVVTDDVSLQESYAESFDEIIRDKGFDELLKRIRENTDKLKKDIAK